MERGCRGRIEALFTGLFCLRCLIAWNFSMIDELYIGRGFGRNRVCPDRCTEKNYKKKLRLVCIPTEIRNVCVYSISAMLI